MVPVIVILTIVVFILVDVTTRLVLKRLEQKRLRRKREEALDIGLRLEFEEEAKTLKRVEVDAPRARILAVDDEPVVLDSFRKILVLAGYSVDTVETGREAVGLVRSYDYDFVYTDLKMPDFDGLEVVKAVKHLRPDIDVVMITGYGTIDSAVAAMKFGAMDYVEKPFTEDELVDFTERCVIRRQARLELEIPPRFHLVTAASGESESRHVINVAGGRFVSPEHTWVGLEMTGEARIGVDDFCVKALDEIEAIDLPAEGRRVSRGEPLFVLRRGGEALTFTSPVSGRVSRVNEALADHLALLRRKPYDLGWICHLEARRLRGDLEDLMLGSDSLDWYGREMARLREAIEAGEHEAERTASEDEERRAAIDRRWRAFDRCFLRREAMVA